MSRSNFDRIRAAFDRAAPAYEEAAVLQREVTTRLLERLQYIKLKPRHVLDLGAGTGTGTRALRRLYPQALVVPLDCSGGMLRQQESQLGFWGGLRNGGLGVCADAHSLPFRDRSFELVFSSLTLQWCDDLPRVWREIFRVLKPGGALVFSSLGPDTLKELRESWAAVDGAPHVNQFLDMHHVGDMLVHTGFADPVMDMEHITLTYKEVTELLKDIKRIGANTLIADVGRGLTGKSRIVAMQQAYAAYRSAEDLYPATYEIVYGLAWGRDPDVQPLQFVPAENLLSR
ncbi:MAG TPA: malonyl-ACP O-methyltransferase BioC [Gammaproteobacteria bacterium]